MKLDPLSKRRVGLVLTLSLVSATMFAFSCEADDDGSVTTPPAEAGSSPKDAAVDRATDDSGIHRDSQVVHALIAANTAEVEHGTLAQTKATNEAVKGFASLMVTEHSAASERLQSFAQQRGITPEANAVSETWKAQSASFASRLEPLTGSAFDKAYMETEIVTHVKLLAIIDDTLAPAIVDPQLEELVAKLRAAEAVHQVQAERIRGALDPGTTRPDASTTGGDGGAGPR